MLPSTKKQAIAAEMQAIAAEADDGVLLAQNVVEAARNPNSTMHDQFEWDDGEAAAAYRLAQARWLIRKVEVVIERIDASIVTAPAFTFQGTVGYLPTQSVVRVENRAMVAIRALKSCESQLERCAMPELDGAVATLRQLRASLEAA